MLSATRRLVNVFRELSRGRAAADRAASKYVELEQPNVIGRAEALLLSGFAYILFGENYCSGVPFSTLKADQTIEYGAPQTTQETFERRSRSSTPRSPSRARSRRRKPPRWPTRRALVVRARS
jgi:hypothetical protein